MAAEVMDLHAVAPGHVNENDSASHEEPPAKRQRSEVTAPKKPLTAYFLFLREVRPAYVHLKASEAARTMSQKWKELSAEEKKAYQDQAAKDKLQYDLLLREYEELQKESQAHAIDEEDNTEAGTAEEEATLLRFPLARIRRIIKKDPEVKQVRADATHAIAKAAELFVEYFAAEAAKVSMQTKRKIVTMLDIGASMRRNPPLEFLSDFLTPSMLTGKASSNAEKKPTPKISPVPTTTATNEST
eukprot:GILK01006053.1.p1 GENE.GILK01006053.1~~GILK01006053.1.p1  ORF type:complete len:273 (-),score=58.05 GILK01006053.1:458-1189(-)